MAFPIRGFWNFWLWLGGEALIGSTSDRRNPSYHETGANATFSSFPELKPKVPFTQYFPILTSSGLKRQSLMVGGMSRAGIPPANATALAVPSYNPSMAKSSIRMGQEQASGLGTGVITIPRCGNHFWIPHRFQSLILRKFHSRIGKALIAKSSIAPPTRREQA